MRKIIFPCILVFLLISFSNAQKTHKIVFYNVENLFDTINDPEVRDDEFTPEGVKKWTSAKYNKKIANIERVFFDIAAIDKNYPAVIGLSEIENRSVLEDIIAAAKLVPANYRIVHYDSPERRGVDVAFLYRPDIFKLEGDSAMRTIIPERPDFLTRDILTMWGKIDNEPFFFMVAHWPSRIGGKERSEYLRVAVGKQMKEIADSIRKKDPKTHFVIMGDFNDDPTDKSLLEALGAKIKKKDVVEGDLYNPYGAMLKAGHGTLAYGDVWNIFDNIIVSENLINGDTQSIQLIKGKGAKFDGNIFKQHYLIQKEGQYKGYPFRTYVGNNFQGGYSDHLPVYIYIGK